MLSKSKTELLNIINNLFFHLKKYEKYLDIIYLFLYLIIFIDSTLLVMGYQDIFSYTMPQWDIYYYCSNILLMFLSSGAISLLLAKKRNWALIYIAIMATIYGLWALLTSYVLLTHSIGYGIIFRLSMGVLVTILLIGRFYFIDLLLKIKELKYNV